MDLAPTLKHLQEVGATRVIAALEEIFRKAFDELARTNRTISQDTVDELRRALSTLFDSGLPELTASLTDIRVAIAGVSKTVGAMVQRLSHPHESSGGPPQRPIEPKYDIFISYAHVDEARVKKVVESLQEAGLRVFQDRQDIPDFKSITRAIAHGLADSKALLAFYSSVYPTRRACQWELTAAFLAGQHEGDPRRRVLVINPEATAGHIDPIELRDALFRSAPAEGDLEAMQALVEAVRTTVAALSGPISAVRSIVAPPWYGGKGLGSSRFVGRVRTFWDLHSALFASGAVVITAQSSPGLAQVRGMGGVGKSLLAEEYALRFGAAYPGGIFVMKGTSDRDDQLADFAARLGVSIRGLDIAQVEGHLEKKLRELPGPYLWLVDDLPGGLTEERRREWFAPNALGKTLITTRSRQYGSAGGVIDLRILDEQEAYDLLAAQREPVGPAEETAARELVGELGQHALAVDVAGGALKELAGRESFQSFLEKVRDRLRDDVLEAVAIEIEPEVPNGHETSIARTLLTSIELLDEPGRDFLRLAAELAPDAIPIDIVDDVFRALGQLSVWGAAGIVKRVVRLSLADTLSETDDSKHQGVSVHILVRRTMRLYDQELDRSRVIRELAVIALGETLPKVLDIRTHAVLARHVAHARHLSSSPTTAREAELLGWVGRHAYERGAYSSARTCEEIVLATMRRLQGDDHSATLTARNNLALTLRAQGELKEAREHQEMVLAERLRVLGDEHPATLIARDNLAGTLYAQGDLNGARAHQEAVRAAMRPLGDDRFDTLNSRLNLGVTLLAQGDLNGARGQLEVALAGMRRLLGEEHPATLTARLNLGGTLHRQGDLNGALEHQEAVLAARRRLLGEEHPDTLAARNNLAMTLRAQGELKEAREHLEAVLVGTRRLLGDEHPSTLTARNNLAGTLFLQGELKEAREHLEAVLAARQRLLGHEHPDSLTARLSLAGTLYAQGELNGALEHQEAVLAARRRLLGEDDLDTLDARNNLAGTLYSQGELKAARQHQEVVLTARRRLLGEEHPDTLIARDNLAGTLGEQGELNAAREQHEAVLAARLRLLGEEHPDTLTARSNLARTLKAQGNLHQAREHQEALLTATRRLLGDEHPATLSARNNLAVSLRAQGDLTGAREHLEAVLAATRRLLGEEHPSTLTARSNLAVTLGEQGDLNAAREQKEVVLATMRRLLGDDHPATLSARNNLAVSLGVQGDLTGAREHLEAVLAATRRLLGEEHPSTLTARSNLARTLKAQGDLSGAREHQEAVLATRRRLLGDDHPDTLTARNNLELILGAHCSG
jgi:tetratricopeptide (TPR) repeat protein